MSLGSSQSSRTRQVAVILITLLAVGGVAVAPGVVVAQDDQDDQPPLPAAYYGDITVNGDAGDNIEITAEINGEERGSIVAGDSTYGGSGTLDEKLVVNGEDGEQGDTVEFFVEGEPAETDPASITYEPGANQQVDITVDLDQDDDQDDEDDGDDDTVDSGDSPVEDNSATVSLTQGSVSSVSVTLPSDSGASSVSVTESNSPTGSATEVPNDVANNVATYLDISADTEVDGDAEVSTTISQSAFDDAGFSTDDAVLLHFVDGSWQELEDTSVSVDGDDVTLTATASSLSPFAVGERSADDDDDDDDDDETVGGGGGGGGGGASTGSEYLVSDLDPQTLEITQGETVTVSATIESDGNYEETKDVDLRVDDNTIATQEVSLSAGDTTTVEFSAVEVSDVEAGEYDFGVYTPDDSETGALTISADDDTADDGTADDGSTDDGDAGEDGDDGGEPSEDPSDETDDGIPGFGPVVALIAVLAAALLAVRRP